MQELEELEKFIEEFRRIKAQRRDLLPTTSSKWTWICGNITAMDVILFKLKEIKLKCK